MNAHLGGNGTFGVAERPLNRAGFVGVGPTPVSLLINRRFPVSGIQLRMTLNSLRDSAAAFTP